MNQTDDQDTKYSHACFRTTTEKARYALPGDVIECLLKDTSNLETISSMIIIVSDDFNGTISTYESNCSEADALGLLEFAKLRLKKTIINNMQSDEEFLGEDEYNE